MPTMVVTPMSVRGIASTRYILLFVGIALILWSTMTITVPKSSLLPSCLRMDSNQTSSVTMNHSTLETFNNPSKSTLNSTRKPSFPGDLNTGQLGIGIPQAQLYMVSLPDRQDRREHMEFLRVSLGLTWTIVDATPRNATLVNRILDWVVFQRAQHSRTPAEKTVFRWPKKINALSDSKEPLRPGGADTWGDQSPPNQASSNQLVSDSMSYQATSLNPSCAVDDDRIPMLKHNPPEWAILTPAKIACWHSHVSAIRQFVDGNESDVVVILEDDINMEKDISRRLSKVWTSLPPGWDILFLGHCWSKESTYPALTDFDDANLHSSFKPKCTHAYALSRSGARRLLQHLRFPPFAYSRALDQAYAWLVQSERLRSYSVVPSVVVQRKSDNSDILPGSGSEWREGLRDGVFGA